MKDSILVVDDCLNLHKLIRAYLSEEPVDIHSAYSGMEAIAAAKENKPSLILLDLDMPELDGFEVCERLKADPVTRGIPIIFLTGDVSPINQVKGLDLGANDYMTKRFKPEELRARIRAALRVSPAMGEASMVDNLTRIWNRNYCELHLPGQISLARRTKKPLTCLMVDVDGLAGINRRFGESVGDEVLRITANVLSSECRTADIVCYLENGTFALLLPATAQGGATRLADRARAQIERQVKNINGVEVDATCSFGLADNCTGDDSMLLDRADAALYRAKRSGRNCVALSQPAAMSPCAVA